ncbi:MAG: hypothetical protein KA217_00515 [Gammaproteobacteria bacterium]|nr:hypothetical protein [Gammaproteobacteria bacterium]
MTSALRKVVAAVLAAGVAPLSWAADFSSEPYLLRLFLGLDRASNYADTAGRQASIAFPGGSSVNPAGDAARPRQRTEVTLTGIGATGDHGSTLLAFPATLAVPTDENTVLSFAYAYTDTPDADTRQGLENHIRSNEFFLGLARRLTPATSVGGQVRVVDSTIDEESRAALNIPARLEVDVRSVDLTLGVQTDLTDSVRLGAMANVGRGTTTDTVQNLAPIPVFPPFVVIPSGTELDRFDDTIYTGSAGVGAAYLPSPALGVFADATYDRVHSRVGGHADIGRFALGVESRPGPAWLALRAGWTLDTESESTLSAGLGLYPTKGVRVDLAVQRNAAPEIHREFGRMDLLTASVAFDF